MSLVSCYVFNHSTPGPCTAMLDGGTSSYGLEVVCHHAGGGGRKRSAQGARPPNAHRLQSQISNTKNEFTAWASILRYLEKAMAQIGPALICLRPQTATPHWQPRAY